MMEAIRSLVVAEQMRQDSRFIESVDIDGYFAKLLARAEWLTEIDGDRLRGVVAYYCNDTAMRRAYISLVLVDPRDRGSGLGKALVLRALDVARARGFKSCRLEVNPSNEPAYAVYRALGFTLVEARATRHLLEAPL
jgi:ribosomal protein S18 acetylase RimI-like enzyme